MKQTLYVAVLLALFSGCEQAVRTENKPVTSERPIVNLPVSMRQHNWTREGSCVHATLVSLLRWQDRPSTADWWRRTHAGGENPYSFAAQLERDGIRYAQITSGDVGFLEWACATRRGCGITVRGGRHMVALVHLDSEWACLMDNNSPEKYIWLPRETVIAEWHASNGWAVTPIYTPAAPLPQAS